MDWWHTRLVMYRPLTALSTLFVICAGALGQAEPFTLTAQTIVSAGLTRPVSIASAPGDPTRLFVNEQYVSGNGRVRIVDLNTNALKATPFLTISSVATGNEQGLLGLCFHPSYSTNGYFFVNYVRGTETRIERYRVSSDPDLADPASATLIMSIPRLSAFHNSGWIEFGPDGMLYIGVGDGSQTMAALTMPETAYAKMLRINVDSATPYAIPQGNPWVGVAGLDEGWLNGLRNPWRCAFDSLTGELWIADVGNALREEITVLPPGTSGQHLGWPCWEGDIPYLTLGTCPPVGTLTAPLYSYPHAVTGGTNCSITGGRVYRGPTSAALRGTYFFSDLCSNKIWSIHRSPTGVPTVVDRTTSVQLGTSVTSFGEDSTGRLYYCTLTGRLVRINATDTACAADISGDGEVAATDLAAILSGWGRVGATREDLDLSGQVDAGDLASILAHWGNCVTP